MSKQIILGYYNRQKNDGLLFGLSKKTYKKNMLEFKKRLDIPDADVIICLFTENFEKFHNEGNELLCDRLQVAFCIQDIKKGYDDNNNFKFIVISEDGENYLYVNGYRETTEEIFEIHEKIRTLDYESFKNYLKEVGEKVLVISNN